MLQYNILFRRRRRIRLNIFRVSKTQHGNIIRILYSLCLPTLVTLDIYCWYWKGSAHAALQTLNATHYKRENSTESIQLPAAVPGRRQHPLKSNYPPSRDHRPGQRWAARLPRIKSTYIHHMTWPAHPLSSSCSCATVEYNIILCIVLP